MARKQAYQGAKLKRFIEGSILWPSFALFYDFLFCYDFFLYVLVVCCFILLFHIEGNVRIKCGGEDICIAFIYL